MRDAIQQRVFVRRRFSDRRFEIDNGAVERAIRAPTIGGNNFLFTGWKDAAVRLAAGDALVQSCRNLGICVREYLSDVMMRLAANCPARRLTEFWPHRCLELSGSEPATAQPGARGGCS